MIRELLDREPTGGDGSDTEIVTVWFNAWQHKDATKVWSVLIRDIFVKLENRAGFFGRIRFVLQRRWAGWLLLLRTSFPTLILTAAAISAGAVFGWAFQDSWFIGKVGLPEPAYFGGGAGGVGGLVMMIRGIISAPASRQLQGFFSQGDLADHPGYLSEVETDIDFLTGLITNRSKHDSRVAKAMYWARDFVPWLAPPRPVRVVVFVDDLDRCPPTKAVDVLEAVKLILERRIFVTFLGLDARVLARAVEDRYKNVLPHSDHPGGAGMEYLEKIIQLPFWLKSGDMKAYVDSLIGGEFDDVAGAAVIPGTLRHEETFETMRAGEDWQTRLGEALEGFHAPERVTLGPDDRNHFGVYAKFFPDNPRAAKRIVNLYRFGKSLGPPDYLNEAMLKWIIVGDRWPHFADFVHLHPNSYKEGDPSTMWSRVLSEFRTSRNGQDPPAALQEILSTGILISPSMLRQIEPYVVNVCPVSQLWPASASAAARQPSQAPY